ncbi:hypothetical protein [Variovorax sp. JS1663]|uniref:hypothetical protein n=1 Tax=Variovorax sp. JS1663 TaxID=1851577 RepID=UPI003FD00CD0
MGVRDALDMLIIDSVRPRTALISSRIEVGARARRAEVAGDRAADQRGDRHRVAG